MIAQHIYVLYLLIKIERKNETHLGSSNYHELKAEFVQTSLNKRGAASCCCCWSIFSHESLAEELSIYF